MDVILTDECVAWYDSLTEAEQETVANVVSKLEQAGVGLAFPHSSEIKGASFALRELRPAAGRSPLRMFYSFDPARDAVLLMGGDKSGVASARFYRSMVALCERIWEEYLGGK